ncbi:MAG TPA: hypothetical protein VET88_14020 [Gammaproteobacteria bacterium]|nr:hypothetical protein [Gammaproteobacteria bacterium]
MSAHRPDVEDYVQLFDACGKYPGPVYREPDDDRYALLFEQVIRLRVRPSPFNLSLPEPFRVAAHRYHEANPATVEHLSDPANRHFMLCDLHDLVMLRGALRLGRKETGS